MYFELNNFHFVTHHFYRNDGDKIKIFNIYYHSIHESDLFKVCKNEFAKMTSRDSRLTGGGV